MKISTRRSFLKLAATFPFFIVWVACGAKDKDPGTPPSAAKGGDCSANGTTASNASNHGHTSPSVSSTDIKTGTQQSYSLGSGTAGHSQTITISASSFGTLQGNQGVSITTDADGTGHNHSVTVNCA